MHELALCAAIADTVSAKAGGRAVRAVHLRIGHYRQVVPATLDFCWEIHVDGTDLQGCGLVVDYIPAMVTCRSCGASTLLTDPLLICGNCDGVDVELVAGDEFEIEAIDVDKRANRSEG